MTIDPTLPFASSSNPDGSKLEPEYKDVYDTWKATPTPQTRSALLKQIKPVLDTATTSYGAGSPTVRGQAKLMALHAMGSYDPRKGRLRTHLLSQLQGLRRVGAKSQNIISVPEQVALDRNSLIAAEKELRNNLGRDPSDGEIADYTKMSLKRLAHVRRSKGSVPTGMVTDPLSGNMPGSVLPNQKNDAWLEFVYRELSPVDQVILDYTLGLHGSPVLPNKDIAERAGITPSAISQRLARIQAALNEGEDQEVF